mmetsp:Transcript_18491/g.49583  ORF Transcript_18491/g.49583 Transcript_18491/m.49583 type:complete len:270 (+) Transcript_18491:2360-3169(+)
METVPQSFQKRPKQHYRCEARNVDDHVQPKCHPPIVHCNRLAGCVPVRNKPRDKKKSFIREHCDVLQNSMVVVLGMHRESISSRACHEKAERYNRQNPADFNLWVFGQEKRTPHGKQHQKHLDLEIVRPVLEPEIDRNRKRQTHQRTTKSHLKEIPNGIRCVPIMFCSLLTNLREQIEKHHCRTIVEQRLTSNEKGEVFGSMQFLQRPHYCDGVCCRKDAAEYQSSGPCPLEKSVFHQTSGQHCVDKHSRNCEHERAGNDPVHDVPGDL